MQLCDHLLGKVWPWLTCVWCFLVFLSLSHMVLGLVCYLIVFYPDICLLPYYESLFLTIIKLMLQVTNIDLGSAQILSSVQ